MKKLLIFLGALAAYGTDCTISDTVRTPFGGYFAGRIIVALNGPGSAQPLYSGSQTLTGWQTTIDVPATANGVVAFTLVCTDTITPSGTSYSARYQPTSGSGWAETWSPATGTTTIRAMRATTVPTPTTTFQASQIVPGSNGQVLTTTAGASAWGSVPACATCVVTSGSYADPAWLTSLAGSKVSGAVASATLAASATALATPRTIAGVSFNGTANISIPSTGLSDTANIVRNNAANAYTAGSKQTFAHSATTAGLNVGVQASAPSSPAQGDVFFNTTLTRKGVYDGTQWRYELYAPSSGTGVVSWDGTSLSASTTLAGLASVTSTSFTGALTGNASTATALASTVASGSIWYGNGTGAPGSASTFVYDSANGRLGIGTNSPPQALSIVGQDKIVGIYSDNNVTGKGGVRWYFNNQTLKWGIGMNQYSTGDFEIFDGSATAAMFKATTRNLLIGTTTDLGYGLHAANKGTNGNFLCFDPTATTGTTKCVARAGQGQSGNIFEIRSYADGVYASFSSTGSLSIPQGAIYNSKVGFGYNSTNEIFLTSDSAMKWMVGTSISGTYDLSLSRASAGVLQVGDGGANANGKIAAGVGLFGSTTDDGANKLQVTGHAIVTNSGNTSLTIKTTTASALIRSVYDYGGSRRGFIDYDTAAYGFVVRTDEVAKLTLSSTGTLQLYNETATTGNTKEVIRAGAGQTTNLTEWQNNAGTVLAYVSSIGTFYSAQRFHTTGDVLLNNAGGVVMDTGGDGVLRLRDNSGTTFSRIQLGGTTSSFPSLKRSSAILQARLADDSAYTDMQVSSIITKQTTPAASSDACTAGSLWADATYIYACTATGVIKRATLASF